MTNFSELTATSKEIVDEYQHYITSGFTPLPVAIVKTSGAKLYDVDGKEYIDLLGMFAVVNMGHNHPKIVKAAQDALASCSMVNSAVMSVSYAKFAKKLSQVFGYDKVVALTSGAEAADAAMKIARKWGNVRKGIPFGESVILTTTACYHGATLSTHALTTPRYPEFGPYAENVGPILEDGSMLRYGVIEDLQLALEKYGEKVSAFMVEPIQGSAGIIIPPVGYLTEAAKLCKKHNVLFITDEVQTGFGRTGYDLASFKEGLKPDLICLGKAISGGVFPLSAVIGDDDLMNLMPPGQIGSTMAATPPATEAAIAALEVLQDEKLSERSLKLGQLFVDYVKGKKPAHLEDVVGQGLFIAVIFDEAVDGRRLAGILAKMGVICKTTGTRRMRVTPPLVISEADLLKGADILCEALNNYDSIKGPIPGEDNTYFS